MNAAQATIGQQFVEGMRRWKALEESLPDGGIPNAIDWDLVPTDEPSESFEHRKEAHAFFAGLAQQKPPTDSLLRKNISACMMTLDVLQGKKRSYQSIATTLLGIRPFEIDESLVQAAVEETATAFREMTGLPYTAKNVAEVMEQHKLTPQQVHERLVEIERPVREVQEQAAGESTDDTFVIELRPREERNVSAEAVTRNGQMVIGFNPNGIMLGDPGSAVVTGAHELAHGLQGSLQRKRIQSGELPQWCAVEATFLPGHSVLTEGIATVLWKLHRPTYELLKELDPWADFRLKAKYSFQLARANYFKLLVSGNKEEAVSYLIERVPDARHEDFRRHQAETQLKKPWSCVYQHSYSLGSFLLASMTQSVPPDVRDRYVRATLSGPVDPAEAVATLQQYTAHIAPGFSVAT